MSTSTQPGPADTRPPALARVVGTVVVAGLAVVAVLMLLIGADAPVATAVALDLPLLVGLLVAVTLTAELVSVRLGHGDSAEELTLLDAAVVVVVLLLPVGWALGVVLTAVLAAQMLRRQPLVKVAFNVGNYALATALLLACVHSLAPTPGVDVRSVLALGVGSLAFALANLVGLAAVIAEVSGERFREIVADGARLSAFMAVSTVAIGTVAVSLAADAPQLLPFTVLPAAALTYAYRSSAQQARERARSGRLLALSEVLAGRHGTTELAEQFLGLCREAFGAEEAWAVLPGEDGVEVLVVAPGSSGVRAPQPHELTLLAGADRGGAVRLGPAPTGWEEVVAAPLDSEGARLGLVLLGRRTGALDPDTAALLTPLASALSAALRAAGHLHRLSEQTAKLSAVVDHSSDGIYVLDGAGRVALWSPSMAAVTGREAAWVLGHRLSDVIVTTDAAGTPVDSQTAVVDRLTPADPRAEVELVVTRPDGDTRWLRCACAGVFDEAGALLQTVVIVHDTTRAHQLERLKSDFIATVSHELRTPVTPIKGYADLLRRKGATMSAEKQAECLDIIVDRSSHLARLVEDLLLVSRISDSRSPAREVRVEVADLGPLVTRAAGDFAGAGAAPGAAERLTVSVPSGPVPVHGDPVRVLQVLGNLVSNALKYSADDAPVQVVLRSEGADTVVEVSDAGRGIPSDQLEQVFEKFHRVEDALRMTTGGTGLGLFIARELTQAMGGTLSVRSVLGEGSTFTLTLRSADLTGLAAAAQERADTEAAAGSAGPRSLPGLPPQRRGVGDGPPVRAGRPPFAGPPPRSSGVAPTGRPPFAGPPRPS